MEQEKVLSVEDIRTQCVIITKEVIKLREAQLRYYRCFRDNPKKSEYLAESKIQEHSVDAELERYKMMCATIERQEKEAQKQMQEQNQQPQQQEMTFQEPAQAPSIEDAPASPQYAQATEHNMIPY